MTAENADAALILGWREWVALPSLGIESIKAKVDTGARTSSLHALNLRSFRDKGAPWARFDVMPLQSNESPVLACQAPVCDHREIRKSNGNTDMRVVVAMSIEVAGNEWPLEVTLTNRRDMRFRMLLGRTALSGHALVDPRRSFMTGKPQKG